MNGATASTYRNNTGATEIQVEVQQRDCTVLSETNSGTVTSFEDEFVDQLILYPNPTYSQVQLRFDGNYRGQFMAEILDIQGKPFVESKFQKNAISFSVTIQTDRPFEMDLFNQVVIAKK